MRFSLISLAACASVVCADLNSALGEASGIAASDATAVSAYWASVIGQITQSGSAAEASETSGLYDIPSLDESQSAQLDSLLARISSGGSSAIGTVSGSNSASATGSHPSGSASGSSSATSSHSSGSSSSGSTTSSGSSSALGGADRTGPVLAAGALAALGGLFV